MKLPVIRALSATFAFLGRNLLDVVRIVWAPMLLLAVINALVTPRYLAKTTAFFELGPNPDPEALLRTAGDLLPDMMLLLAFDLIAFPVIFAGLLKLVLTGERPPRIAYLGFGLEEVRIIGTWVISFLIVLALLLLSQIISGAAQSLGQLAGAGGGVIGFVLNGAVLALMIWVGVRISLATAAAVGEQKLGVRPAWNASRGGALSLLALWAIFALAGFLLQNVLLYVLSPDQAALLAEASKAQTAEAQAELNARANAAAVAALDLTQPVNLARFVISHVANTGLVALTAIASGVAWLMLTGARSGEARPVS